jgi:threonyl-tRNA synthetase
MIHRAMLGSLERFFGVYLEHVAGRFPTWLAPVQVAILPITDAHLEWAREVEAALAAAGLRALVDARSEKLGLKIREATLLRVPYMLVLGDKEVEARGVAPRTRDGKTGELEPLSGFVARLAPRPRSRPEPVDPADPGRGGPEGRPNSRRKLSAGRIGA